MGSPIDPGNLVSQGYSKGGPILANWSIIHIHTVLEGFETRYDCETRYVNFAWVYGTLHLNLSHYPGALGSQTLTYSIGAMELNTWWDTKIQLGLF